MLCSKCNDPDIVCWDLNRIVTYPIIRGIKEKRVTYICSKCLEWSNGNIHTKTYNEEKDVK